MYVYVYEYHTLQCAHKINEWMSRRMHALIKRHKRTHYLGGKNASRGSGSCLSLLSEARASDWDRWKDLFRPEILGVAPWTGKGPGGRAVRELCPSLLLGWEETTGGEEEEDPNEDETPPSGEDARGAGGGN